MRHRFTTHPTLRAFAALAGLAPWVAPAARAQRTLDELVVIGLRQNLGQRQIELGYQKSEAAVDEARGRFLPTATFNARYTQASGNVVNLGSLINPAFSALNQLTGGAKFPTNLDLQLPQRQETAVRLAQPVFQPAVIEGYRIAARLRDAQGAQRDAQLRELAARMRSAYLQVSATRRVLEMYDATMPLVSEQVRVAEALVAAGRATPDAVFRARAERSDVQQRRNEAMQNAAAAARALNFLLERPLDAEAPAIADSLLGIGDLPTLEAALASARAEREELRGVEWSRQAAVGARRLALGTNLPAVSLAVDYGVQGNKYEFSRDRTYTQASLLMSWSLFSGMQDAARAAQAGLEERRLAAQGQQLERLVSLEVRQAWGAAEVARDAIASADERAAAARRSYDLVRRRYELGGASQLELLDARTQLTSAELNRILTDTDYRLRRVQLDRAAALYPRILP
ncbi:MAG: TolC family protein [Gemmatimonadetes bacterium]|nr:TolC family protein [Gemmatimonadota bacterium]